MSDFIQTSSARGLQNAAEDHFIAAEAPWSGLVRKGQTIRFKESLARPMGRATAGVIGMRLADDSTVVSLIVAQEGDILTATERGYGKRTELAEFPKKGRGTQGVIGIQCSERNGGLVAAVQVTDAHELMLISNQGTLVRTRVAEVSQLGRNTQGVTLIKLPADENLVSVVRLDAEEDNGELPDDGEEPSSIAAPGSDELQ